MARRIGAAALVISLAGCGQELTSPDPLPQPPLPSSPSPPPAAGLTVSGTAIEFTESQESAGSQPAAEGMKAGSP